MKTPRAKAVYIERDLWTMWRASPIQTPVSQALAWGLPQAQRRAFERGAWVERA